MFWGLFLVLLGGLLVLDRWDVYHGGLISKLLISALIAWGMTALLDRGRFCVGVRTRRTDDRGVSTTIDAAASREDPPR